MKPENNDKIAQEYETNEGYRKRARNNLFPLPLLNHIVESIPQDGKFLDAGCGVGSFLKQLIRAARNKGRSDIKFFAIDYAQAMADEARRENPEATIFQDDLKNLSSEVKTHTFDYVNSTDVLFFFNPELGERDKAFASLRSVTKKDGLLRIAVREQRFDKEPSPRFSDFSENDLRTTMQKFGFAIESSRIGNKKNYGPATQDNLDRFYDSLVIVGRNIEQTPSPRLADIVSERRAEALKNEQRGRGGSLKIT